jgi:phosphate starvation-inducible membrane PsiE
MRKISKCSAFTASLFPRVLFKQGEIKGEQSRCTLVSRAFVKLIGALFSRGVAIYSPMILKEIINVLTSYLWAPQPIKGNVLGYECDISELLICYTFASGGQWALERIIKYLINRDGERAVSLRLQEYALMLKEISGPVQNIGQKSDEIKGFGEAVRYGSKLVFELWASFWEYVMIVGFFEYFYGNRFMAPVLATSLGSILLIIGDIYFHYSLAAPLKEARTDVMSNFNKQFNDEIGSDAVTTQASVRALESTHCRRWWVEFSFSVLLEVVLALGLFWIIKITSDVVMDKTESSYTVADFVVILFIYLKMINPLTKFSEHARLIFTHSAYFPALLRILDAQPAEAPLNEIRTEEFDITSDDFSVNNSYALLGDTSSAPRRGAVERTQTCCALL